MKNLKRIVFALFLPAISTLAQGQGLSGQDASAAAAKAFSDFWKSTNCDEMKALSDWPKLMIKTDSSDEQLCESLIGMHQFVQKIEVLGVKALPDNSATVKANITLISQASMKQEQTLRLIDGKWRLAP